QFCRIGQHCFTGMGSVISKDVPPYVMAAGHPARPHGINSEGLQRRGFTAEQIATIKRAYKTLYTSELPLAAAREQITALAAGNDALRVLADFLAVSERSIVR
ncbi:MAG: acyl-[acyl-carrier-protein]--UDP-N-acetylglucosamine O-acyltransferase, partial [Gammaproteobacteria bacterium]|nr:acyl-[acyl-carrier-protein]--UDP-N-acetylglucosamine O-acyltransferase [Gammaproteobacteria bacterium]